MADWCPAPEDRNVIVGVAVSFVYAIDSFANGTSLIHLSTPNQIEFLESRLSSRITQGMRYGEYEVMLNTLQYSYTQHPRHQITESATKQQRHSASLV